MRDDKHSSRAPGLRGHGWKAGSAPGSTGHTPVGEGAGCLGVLGCHTGGGFAGGKEQGDRLTFRAASGF